MSRWTASASWDCRNKLSLKVVQMLPLDEKLLNEKWSGHLATMPPTCLWGKVFWTSLTRKRLQGRPRICRKNYTLSFFGKYLCFPPKTALYIILIDHFALTVQPYFQLSGHCFVEPAASLGHMTTFKTGLNLLTTTMPLATHLLEFSFSQVGKSMFISFQLKNCQK